MNHEITIEFKNIMSLTVDIKHNNTLKGLVCNEFYNYEMANLLLNCEEEALHLGETSHFDDDYNPLELFEKIHNSSSNGHLITTYDRSHAFGRVSAKLSLSMGSLYRGFRHTIARDNYIDIDIDNAHPVFMLQLLEYNGYDPVCLRQYVENREMYFNCLRDAYDLKNHELVIKNYSNFKDIPKNLFIRLMYGGAYEAWLKDFGLSADIEVPLLIREFIDGLQEFMKIICNANGSIQNVLIKNEGSNIKNLVGKTCAHVMQDIEARILELIHWYFTDKGFINGDCVLCFDGLMIRKERFNNKIFLNMILQDLSFFILSQTGYKLSFSCKPMNEGYSRDYLLAHQKKGFYDLTIDEQYLDDNQQFMDALAYHFDDSDKKILSITSCYGSGKTTALKHIFFNYGMHVNSAKEKSILYISYRKTLSADILKNFDGYGFQSYLDIKGSLMNVNRLIIQVESIARLCEYSNSKVLYKMFDYIIIDECEGCLNQYDSPTCSKSKMCFDMLVRMITHAEKVVMLDGDIMDRSKSFINHFNSSYNILNLRKPPKKIFTLSNDSDSFYNAICEDLRNGLNLNIVTMSATKGKDMHKKLVLEFPDIADKIVYYYGGCNDALKEDFKNVTEAWIDKRVVMYSPTVEAGLDFNKEHFNKQYVIISKKSNSIRALFQMMSRIRKFSNNDVLCYTELKYRVSSIQTYRGLYVSTSLFREYPQYMEPVQASINNGVLTTYYVPSLFLKNYIHNRVEIENKNCSVALFMFERMALSKGHEFINALGNCHNPTDDVIPKIEMILTAPYINDATFEEYENLRLRDMATEEMKLSISKYIFLRYIGLSNFEGMPLKVLKKAYNYSFRSFTHLIHPNNLPKVDENTPPSVIVNRAKSIMISDMLDVLNFGHVYKGNIIECCYIGDYYKKFIKKYCPDHYKYKNFNKLYNISTQYKYKDIETMGPKALQFLNNIVDGYGIHIRASRYGKGMTKRKYYIELDPVFHELLTYKVDKGYYYTEHNMYKSPVNPLNFQYLECK